MPHGKNKQGRTKGGLKRKNLKRNPQTKRGVFDYEPWKTQFTVFETAYL